MNTAKSLLIASATFLGIAGTSMAQDSTTEFQLPEHCRSAMEMSMSDGGGSMDQSGSSSEDEEAPDAGSMGMGMMGMENMDMGSLEEFQRENMERMMASMPAMHKGMMIDDPDVAFACAMIAHHQGAIDMAQVQLEHGEDEFLLDLAQTIIDDQKKEIAEMTQWLEENAAQSTQSGCVT